MFAANHDHLKVFRNLPPAIKNYHTMNVKSFLFAGALIILCAIVAKAQEEKPGSPKEFTIDNCVSSFNWQDTINTAVGYQFWFVNKDFIDGRTLKMSVVAPGSATHPPHQHAEDEFFFVLEGTAEFYLDGKTAVGKAYSSFYCPPNIPHGIRNIGKTELKYLVIKKYTEK